MKELFWADELAKEIRERKRFKYINKKIPKPDKFVVKTSASISGVLHIGRLSDTIRGESVVRALQDAGHKAEFIWVAEDMDSLRKVPKGVSKKYSEYIGVPVTDIPDPFGCHKSYGEHHTSRYFEVMDKFVSINMKKFSMREEYKKGNFRPFIKTIMEKMDIVVEIQNKYRTHPLEPGWSPWTPICKDCGKIITPRILKFEDGKIHYKCHDYRFEKTVAKGCSHEGIADPLKDSGKLLWKGEWAAQWTRWKAVSEGGGKEYQVPLSAFWVNAELCERVLGFPSPVPIFYEHLIIDGKKMSASLGNVVYPDEWLEVATPELLKYLYNKRLMKTRSFSWKDLPKLFDEYYKAEDIYFGKQKLQNEKEEAHIKRLFEMSQIKKPETRVHIPYDFAAMLSQTVPGSNADKIITILKRTGHVKADLKSNDKKRIEATLILAKNWAEKYAPEEDRIKLADKPQADVLKRLSSKQKAALKSLAKILEKEEFTEKDLYAKFFDISKETGLEPKDLFRAAYLILIGKESGPRLSPFILAIGQDVASKRLSSI